VAMNVEYTVRETLTNLRRNLLMTVAAVLTVAVSLTLVGSALLIREAVNHATIRWRGGIEFAIYLNPDAASTELDAIATELQNSPQVETFRFVDQEEAYEEFQRIFQDSPEMTETVQPEELPPSFRVVPRDPDNASAIDALGRRFQDRPGVNRVVFAKDTADAIVRVTSFLQLLILAVALALGVAATFQILTTIQLAIFARRREIEVMKLVGATNWFIRVPFMMEGMVHGFMGAGAAFAVVAVGRGFVMSAVRNNQLFAEFFVSWSAVLGTGALLFAVGVVIGALGSGTAVSRFLDV